MLFECLWAVADHRRAQGQRYALPHLLLFSILAILSGATSYRKIQRFIHAHRERLNGWFGLRWKRAPAHTSIRYILQGLDEAELERAFRVHSRRLLESQAQPPQAEPAEATDRSLAIALDGKVLRGSFDRFQDHKAVQLLSAFCQDEQLILGHLPVATQTNEIPVAQQLIKELGLTDCLYTLDALHCQKNL
jgi:DDE_Tnp_1-associated